MKIKHPHRFIVFILAIPVVFGLVYMVLDQSDFHMFKLNSVTSGTQTVPDVRFFVKTTTAIFDKDNNLLSTSNSKFFEGSPTFDVTAITNDGKELGLVQIDLKARATFPGGNEKTTKYPLVIDKSGSTIFIDIMAKNSKDTKILVESIKVPLKANVELYYNKESSIYFIDVDMQKILENLDEGKYKSLMEIQVYGTLKMHYKGFAGANYYLTIPQTTSIKTWHDFNLAIANGLGGIDDIPSECDGDASCTEEKLPNKDPNNGGSEDITKNGIFAEISDCIQIGDTECLDNAKFYPIYAMGIVGLFVAFYLNRTTKEQVIGLQPGMTR